uniref:Tetraspanin n=1 Tax=Timema shepardi TaxID=629360 RepID=A0A7R9AWL3_TIMSH|nr:unnamed protein product [Timema shepardi]
MGTVTGCLTIREFEVITGIVVLSVGAVIKTAYYNYEDFLDDSFFSVPSLLIAIGAIVIIVSFFGCCGSVKENHCMVITFSVFLIFIFILELSAGIAGYVLKNNAEQFIVDKLEETMNKYNNSTEITKAWDELQTEMTCCGIHSASDWSPKAPTTTTPPTNASQAPTLNLPMSCCSPVNGMWGSVNCTEDSPNLYTVGCLNKLGLFAKEHAVTLGGVGIGIAFLQGYVGQEADTTLEQLLRHKWNLGGMQEGTVEQLNTTSALANYATEAGYRMIN